MSRRWKNFSLSLQDASTIKGTRRNEDTIDIHIHHRFPQTFFHSQAQRGCRYPTSIVDQNVDLPVPVMPGPFIFLL
jgi:hypothetical protein